MKNIHKWLIAFPFAALHTLVIPFFFTGSFLWFLDHWSETVYIFLSAGMWLTVTAFVDLSRPRGRPDSANLLLSLGLILSLPISVWDRSFFWGSKLPEWVSFMGVGFCLGAITLGVWARIVLGRSYQPSAQSSPQRDLILSGPYYAIRHPMYTSALLWAAGWPLVIASVPGALLTLGFFVPGIVQRIDREEKELVTVYGSQYAQYRARTWRLFPLIY